MAIKILVGDCRRGLRGLETRSVQCLVTSPPYWGFRDYDLPPLVWGGVDDCQHEWITGVVKESHFDKGTSTLRGPTNTTQMTFEVEYGFCRYCDAWCGSLGLEPTIDLYVQHLVEIFREVRRVLRDDGTVWLNLGDSYNAGTNARRQPGYGKHGYWPNLAIGHRVYSPSLKPKDLCGVPWTVALALRADGWWLRRDIIWHKPDAMPESVYDRPTTAHEYLFLFSKSQHYFYDWYAISEPAGENTHSRGKKLSPPSEQAGKHKGWAKRAPRIVRRRNKRSVWTIPTARYAGPHYATYPPGLVEPCIKAGTSERGACPKCGGPWVRVVEKGNIPEEAYLDRPKMQPGNTSPTSALRIPGARRHMIEPDVTIGWRPSCVCYGTPPFPKYPKQQEDEPDEAYAERTAPIRAERLRLVKEWETLEAVPCVTLDPPHIPDESVNMIVTDPPWNLGKDFGPLVDDQLPEDEYLAWYFKMAAECYRVMTDGYLYVSCATEQLWTLRPIWKAVGFVWDLLCIWHGPNYAGNSNMIRQQWQILYEPIMMFHKGKKLPMLNELRGYQTDAVMRYTRPQSDYGGELHREHVCQKPRSLYVNIIGRTPGRIVYDPFIGSGTTGMAAKVLRRPWLGFEIEPSTAQIGRRRIAQTKVPLLVLEIEQQLEMALDYQGL